MEYASCREGVNSHPEVRFYKDVTRSPRLKRKNETFILIVSDLFEIGFFRHVNYTVIKLQLYFELFL